MEKILNEIEALPTANYRVNWRITVDEHLTTPCLIASGTWMTDDLKSLATAYREQAKRLADADGLLKRSMELNRDIALGHQYPDSASFQDCDTEPCVFCEETDLIAREYRSKHPSPVGGKESDTP